MHSPLPKNNNPKFYHLRNKIHKPGHTLHLQVLTRRQQLALKQLHDDEEGAEGKKGKKGKGKGKGRGKGKGKGKGKTKNKGKGAVSPKKPQKKVTPKKKASPKTKHESSTEDQEPLAKKPRTRKPKVEGTTIPDEPCPPPTSSAAKPKPERKKSVENPKVKESSPPKTFARRARPISSPGNLKWDAIRAAFNEEIRPHVVKPSVHEDRQNRPKV